mmetsp:Transcript_454/g.1378  ORF Transcript_454/g.1378 Transcript_454/m.1378 type:complete len:139 (-) Transcript_454:114-530(-)
MGLSVPHRSPNRIEGRRIREIFFATACMTNAVNLMAWFRNPPLNIGSISAKVGRDAFERGICVPATSAPPPLPDAGTTVSPNAIASMLNAEEIFISTLQERIREKVATAKKATSTEERGIVSDTKRRCSRCYILINPF